MKKISTLLCTFVLLSSTFFISLHETLAQTNLPDTTDIGQVVIQENRFHIPFNKNNRNVQVLTQEDIKKLPGRTLNEILGQLNGVDIRQRGPFGAQADIGIDGGSFDQTLILINGVKVSDPQTGHHSLNLPIPLDAIERIEVLRGPSSRIYGINGLTGSVNIVTKAVASTAISAHLYGGSSFKKAEDPDVSGVYYAEGVQLGGRIAAQNHNHQLYLTREKSNGQRYNTASENYRAFYQNQIDLNANNQIGLMGGFINNDFGANGYYAAPGDVESEEVVQTAFVNLESRHSLSDRLWISPRINYRFNKDDYRYYRNDLTKGRSEHETNIVSVELNGRYHTSVGDIGVGAESRFEKIASTNMDDHDRSNHGYYAEFRTEQIRNLILNVGTYVNYNTKYGWQVFPGIDASYFLHTNWRIAVNAGSSQRIPTFTDLFLKQTGNVGNPDLATEQAWQAEGLLKFEKDNFQAQAGYFYRNVSDFIDWHRSSTDDPYRSINIEKNSIQGVNASFKYRNQINTDVGYQLGVGYNYLKPTLIETVENVFSKYVIENLKHQVNVSLNLSYRKWLFSTANRFIQRASNNSYLVSDWRIQFQTGRFAIYTDVQNLFDTRYVEAMAIPMPGRWHTLGVKYQWDK